LSILCQDGGTNVAGKITHVSIDTPSSRLRLKTGRNVFWNAVPIPDHRVHIGWQRTKGERNGRWLMRRYLGSSVTAKGHNFPHYSVETLGAADDAKAADGKHVLSFEQAVSLIRKRLGEPDKPKLDRNPETYTVWQAWEDYAAQVRAEGREPDEVRAKAHIQNSIGPLVVASELTTQKLQDWLTKLATAPAQLRSRKGQLNYRRPKTDDAKRARRASANRVLTLAKAALNFAFKQGVLPSDNAWKRVSPFKQVDSAFARYLETEDANRLINVCSDELRPLVQAALLTGARYGELTRMKCEDFNARTGKLVVRKSKSGKPRDITLTEQGVEFFRHHCAGRTGLMFTRANGYGWSKNDQSRPMREAVTRAKIEAPFGFHALRHTWASLSVMNGMPLIVVAKNLGHRDTRMVEKVYGHMSESYLNQIIREKAPTFEIQINKTVAPLR
jgi:integrase